MPSWLWATPADLQAALRPIQQQITAFRSRMEDTLKKFEEAFEVLNQETTRIGTKMQELLDRLAAGGLSEEEEAGILAQLSAAGERLKAIGADPATPIPPDAPEV